MTPWLRALVEEIKGVEDAGLVAMGDADWDPMVAPLVAALLGWPLLTAVDEVAIADGSLVVTRRHGMGTQDVAVTGPVVVDVAARREEEEKPGMRQVLAARKKPSDTKTVEGDRSAFSSRGTRLPEATSSRLFDGSDPADAVEQLVSAPWRPTACSSRTERKKGFSHEQQRGNYRCRRGAGGHAARGSQARWHRCEGRRRGFPRPGRHGGNWRRGVGGLD